MNGKATLQYPSKRYAKIVRFYELSFFKDEEQKNQLHA